MTRSTIPQKEQVEVPAEAKAAAKRAARLLSPTCDVCGVEYVEEYRGPCQEPLPPYEDPSKTCRGKVDLTPESIAEKSLQAAAPVLCAQERERIGEVEKERDEARAVIARLGGVNPDEGVPAGPNPGELMTWGEAGRRLEDLASRADQAAQQERERVKKFIGAVKFEVGCMKDYSEGRRDQLGKLAREIAEPLEAALTTLDKETD